MQQKPGRYIISGVNPKDVTWRMPQRSSVQKTRMGEIMHIWKDRQRGTYFDEPQLSINFQSGNIMPIRRDPVKSVRWATVERENGVDVYNHVAYTEPSDETVRVPTGLQNFYEFLSLVDEQKILPSGATNFVYIIYNSRIFPNMTLAGLFTPEGASWTDSSDSPNEVTNWTANFTIYDTFPKLNDSSTLMQVFQDAGWGRI